MTFVEDLKYQIKYSTPILKLVVINIGVFISLGLVNLVLFLTNIKFEFISSFLLLSSDPHHFLHTPWTLFSYQFIHTGFIHLLFNMMTLYFIGQLFTDFFKRTDAWRVYLLGGLTGGLLYVASYSLFPVFSNHNGTLEGASGGIIAILFATATYAPNVRIALFGIFHVRLVWLALGYLFLDLISIPSGNSGGHIAHIGGALFGFIFARYRQGTLQVKLFDTFSTKKPDERKFKIKVHAHNETKQNTYNKSSNSSSSPTQEEIDIILDKISKNGYEKLSKQEKDILFKASQD
ncbi:MAG: rhomboid family intramembrane serine protease [Bacteroidota bacterium]